MKTYHRIRAVQKACEIIRFISDNREPASVYDIVDFTGMSYSAVMQYLTTLEDQGFVISDGDKWNIGPFMAIVFVRFKKELNSHLDTVNALIKILNI